MYVTNTVGGNNSAANIQQALDMQGLNQFAPGFNSQRPSIALSRQGNLGMGPLQTSMTGQSYMAVGNNEDYLEQLQTDSRLVGGNQNMAAVSHHPQQQVMLLQADPSQQAASQYETVMQMMHQDLQRLMLENQHLSTMVIASGQSQNPIHQQPQVLQNPTAVDQSNSLLVAAVKEEANECRKQAWEREQEVERLNRELRHTQGMVDDLRNEISQSRQKREDIDNMLQDAKGTICQQMIQARQQQSQIDQQTLEIAGLQSQVRREQALTEQAMAESQRLRSLLDENEAYKLQQMQILDSKEREIQNLRAVIRRLMNVITTHRESFGDLADLNYEMMFKDISNMNLQYQQISSTQTQFINQLLNSTSQFRMPQDFHKDFLGQENMYQVQNLQSSNFQTKGSAKNIPDDYQSIIEKYNPKYNPPQATLQPSKQTSARNQQVQGTTFGQGFQETDQSFLNQQSQIFNSMDNTRVANGPINLAVPSWASNPSSGLQSVNRSMVAQPTQYPQQQAQRERSQTQVQAPGKKPINVDAIKGKLRILQDEKRSLEEKLQRANNQSAREEYQFEMDVTNSNIKTLQDKLSAAGVSF